MENIKSDRRFEQTQIIANDLFKTVDDKISTEVLFATALFLSKLMFLMLDKKEHENFLDDFRDLVEASLSDLN